MRALRQAGLKFTDIQPTYLTLPMPAPRSSKVTLTPGLSGILLLRCIITGRRAGAERRHRFNQTGSFYLAARPYAEKNGALFRVC